MAENQVVNSKPKFSVVLQSDSYKRLINNTLGDPERAKRFVASISSAVASNPQLQECTPNSIISGALLGEALNLSPSPQLGQYYLVGYKNKQTGETEAQFQMGYKGYITMLIRSGLYKDLDVTEIREGEFRGRDKNTGKYKFEFIENESEKLSKPVIGYMAYYTIHNDFTNNDFTKVVYMSKEEMEQHANTYSKAFNLADYERLKAGQIPEKDMWKYSSFWYKNFDGMAKKTVLRQLISKWGVLSTDNPLMTAMEKDMAVIKEDGTYEYVDNPNTDTIEVNYEEKPTTLGDI